MSLYDLILERLKDPELVRNFNNTVGERKEVTEEDEQRYELARQAFEEYKKSKK